MFKVCQIINNFSFLPKIIKILPKCSKIAQFFHTDANRHRLCDREMEYLERSFYNLFSNFKTNTKSIDIDRVFRCCVLMKKSKHRESHEMG